MAKLDEQQIAHLSLIQGVIIRMGTNSFALKTLAVTVAAAVIAIAAARTSGMEYIPLAALLPVFLFWVLEAQYLHIEKCYRKLYDTVRKGGEVEVFSMDYTPYKTQVESVPMLVVWNWSITPFFGAIALVLIASYYFLKCGG